MKVGIIGLGHIAKKHGQAIALLDQVEWVAGCDVKENKQLDIPQYRSLEDMLEHHPDIDLVSVCTPNGMHQEHAFKALDLDKCVLCEKPMTLTKYSAELLIEKALQKSKYFFCVMQNRYAPVSQWLKSIIEEDRLGEVYMINVHAYWNRDSRYYTQEKWQGSADLDGGTLYTQFAHFIDNLYWLFGPIEIQHACFRNFNHQGLIDFEDAGQFDFTFAKRGIGQFQYTTSTWDKNFESTLTIVGEKGTVQIGGQYMNKVNYCHIDNYTLPQLSDSDNIENLSKVYSNAWSVMQKKASIMTNAMDGLKVVELIEQVYQYKKQLV